MYQEMRGSLQASSMGSGQEDVSQAQEDRNPEHERCIKKYKRPPPTHQNPRSVTTNNFFAPLGDLPMENAETASEGNSTKTPGTNDSPGKGRLPPTVLTSEANLINLQRELKTVVTGECPFLVTLARFRKC
jgi:hypothetical protein